MTVRDLIEIIATVDYLSTVGKYKSEEEAYKHYIECYFIYQKDNNVGLGLISYDNDNLPSAYSLSLNTEITKKGIVFIKWKEDGIQRNSNAIDIGWWRKHKANQVFELSLGCQSNEAEFIGFVDVAKEEVIYGVDKKSFKYEKGLWL